MMKNTLKAFVALLLFSTSLLFGAALDIRIPQRNASNTAWPDVILPGTPNMYIGTNGTGQLALLAGGGGGGGSGSVTSASVVTANGVSATVANPTTTPAFTFSLGAITPTSVVASGAIQAGTTLTVTGAAAPTTATAGQFGFDNNAWAAGRGAFQLFDGTANTYVVAALASDTPTNGQIIKWNTGGTITWEDDAGAAGTTVGTALFNLADPSAITFIRINADNSVTALPAANQRTALGLVAVAASGSATDLTAGTLPDARFPATLPAASGVNLTALTGSNISTGTVADARIAATLTRNVDFDTATKRAALGFKTTTHGGLEVRQDHSLMGATETLDLASANAHIGTLDANLTVTITGFTSGTFCSMVIGFTQDATGSRTVTWPAAVVTAPTVTATPNTVTWITLWSTDGGTTLYASSTADGGGGSGTVTSSSSPTNGQIAIFTSATDITGNTPTGTGSVVRATAPTIDTPVLTTPTISGAVSFPDGVLQTFNPNATTPGVNVGSVAGDPSAPTNGALWYDSTANELTARVNGANVILGTRTGVVREIWIGAGAMTPSAVNGAATGTYAPAGADGATYDVFDFDDTTSESVQFTIAMPSTWNLGTVKTKAYWTTTSGTGTVIWGVAAGAASDDDALGATLGTQITVTDTRLADNDLHTSPATAAITVGGTPALDDLTLFKVVRDISDTKTGDARLIGVKLQYTESATEPTAW